MNELDLLKDNITAYVVRPLNAFGVGGFVFDVEGDTEVNLSTEITDHFLEDNSAVQDHIAIRPKKVTLRSYVGELVEKDDEEEDTFAEKVTQKLTVLTQFLPTISDAAQLILDAETADEVAENFQSETINKVTDYWAFLKNLSNAENRQERAYQYFKALMEQKILLSVQTPFEYMNNMAIESITAVQPEKSKFISDFSITLKEIRTIDSLVVPEGQVSFVGGALDLTETNQGRSALQNQTTDRVGQVSGNPPLLDEVRTEIVKERFGL